MTEMAREHVNVIKDTLETCVTSAQLVIIMYLIYV